MSRIRTLKRNHKKVPYVSSRTGEVLPGVTSILGILDKPALVGWAYQQGKKGIPLDRAKTDAAEVGTLCHYFIESFVTNQKPKIDESFPIEFVLHAGSMFRMFAQYWRKRHAALLGSEIPLIDEDEGYGGTVDLLVECDEPWRQNIIVPQRVNELWDYKSSKAIWPEMWIQTEAYTKMVKKLIPNVLTRNELTPRVVNITKELIFDAPDIPEYGRKAAAEIWEYLPKLYNPLKAIRG